MRLILFLLIVIVAACYHPVQEKELQWPVPETYCDSVLEDAIKNNPPTIEGWIQYCYEPHRRIIYKYRQYVIT